MTAQRPFSGAIMLDSLIGRDKDLAAVLATCTPQDDPTRFECVAIVAPGGIGKTRISNEVAKHVGAGQLPVIALRLIDVAQPSLHNAVTFLQVVREYFDGTRGALFFAGFDKAMTRYQDARDSQTSYQRVKGLIAELLETFHRDYRALTQQFRVVWMLDTLEQLVAIPAEIETLLRDIKVKTTQFVEPTYDWILDFVAKRPANTTLILAGRPEPERWLEDLKHHVTQTIELEALKEPDVIAYLHALKQQLASDDSHEGLTSYLNDFIQHPAHVKRLYDLTDGNPIRLGLYIDLLANSDRLNQRLRTAEPVTEAASKAEFDTPLLGAMEPVTEAASKAEFDTHLLDHIAHQIGHPSNRFLGYLYIMRRGLDLDRLNRLWGGPPNEAEEGLEYLKRLSFVKVRADGRIVLHDELYTIYQLCFERFDEARQNAERTRDQDIFKKLIAFCQDQIDAYTKDMRDLHEQIDYHLKAHLIEPAIPEALANPEVRVLLHQLRVYRLERQALFAEQVHYSLFENPDQGFNITYYNYAETAFAAAHDELDALLQSEVDLFFFGSGAGLIRGQTGIAERDWDILRLTVSDERITRWIKRLILLGHHEKAEQFAAAATKRYEELFYESHKDAMGYRLKEGKPYLHPLTESEWTISRALATIHEGRQSKAIEDLHKAVAIVEAESVVGLNPYIPDASETRCQHVRAQGFVFIGYAYATLSSFHLARKNYQIAREILKEIDFDALYAEVLNNLSRVVGELGDGERANQLCQHGLVIRQRLGFDYLVGLSLNTLSIINMRTGRPNTAVEWANKALLLFRHIYRPRGLGLTLLQAGEAKFEARQLTPALGRLELLREAEDHFIEAIDIFTSTVQEDVRLLAAYTELGVLHVGWTEASGGQSADPHYATAREYFAKAMALAKALGAVEYQIDVLVHEGTLAVTCGEMGQAQDHIQAAWDLIDTTYILSSDHRFVYHDDLNVIVFTHLSNIHRLWAKILPSAPTPEYLKHHVLAITYTQLFSPMVKSWFLSQIKAGLVQYLIKLSRKELRTARTAIESVIAEYHLADLTEAIGPLEVELVLQEID